MRRQKKVALFISHIFGEYQKNLSNGIIYQATEYGYSVDIFVSNDGEAFGDLGIGEEGILSIPRYKEYRGIIVASGTYIVEELRNRILDMIKENCNCPIVNICQGEEDLLSVEIDNINPMKELIEHLILAHNYNSICFLGYKNEEYFANQRLKSFEDILTKHHIPFDERNISWTYDNYSSVKKSIEYLISNFTTLPNVIICYNDTIALIAARVLTDMGYEIPKDIAITGYDNLDIGKNNIPSLTSVQFPVFEMGMKAMEKIYQTQLGYPVERKTILPTHPIIRASCGCNLDNNTSNHDYYYKLLDRISSLEKNSILDMNMAGSLTNITNIDDGMDALETFTKNIENLEGLYICLYSNWDSLSNKVKEVTNYEDDTKTDDDIIFLKFGLKNKKRLPECSFHKKHLLPEYIYQNSSSSYLYMPLYFKEKNFGYISISYHSNKISYDFSFMSWLRNLNNMLQRICSNIELNMLVSKLEELYLKDETTNVYNVRGFQKQIDDLLEKAYKTHQSIILVEFTLCEYKKINDTYGNLESNFAIKVLAKAIESSMKELVLLARKNENTFILATLNYKEHDITLFIDRIQKYLANYNTLYPKEYNIHTKSNYYILNPESHSTLTDLQNQIEEIITSTIDLI
jgi:diguanylate cyclase (GGDEF)-like protein